MDYDQYVTIGANIAILLCEIGEPMPATGTKPWLAAAKHAVDAMAAMYWRGDVPFYGNENGGRIQFINAVYYAAKGRYALSQQLGVNAPDVANAVA